MISGTLRGGTVAALAAGPVAARDIAACLTTKTDANPFFAVVPVIGLDTPLEPADAADATFAMLDLAISQPSVDLLRDQGFGIDLGDPKKWGDEDDPRIVFDTGVKLITDKPVDGVASIDTAEGLELCWG